MTGALRIGIDTGGTFTDVVAFDERTGTLTAAKTPSTPADPARGFVAGLRKILDRLGADPSSVESISHGTTVATNQLLEGRIGELGFITTEGYEFVLEIARQSVPDGYGNSYFWVKPDRIVPADLVRTVRGRLDHTGAELRPFDEDQAAEVARWFRDRGVDTIGVCFLHSYADPEHELRMRAVLAREHPAAVVSISSDVLREYREYERSVTTLVDAAVKPTMSRYLRTISDRLHELAGATSPPFYVMTSNGGVLSAGQVQRRPITTVLSGPAAGALGAALIARTAGFDDALTLDGGGTSTDVCLVLAGEPTLTTEGSVGGYPSKIPMIDVVTVGAGGGSIAWVSPERALKVGPRSAGAEPGPLCYGKGGTAVTVTDAHVALGRIPPRLLGGEISLDVEAARAGVAELADRLGLDVTACAAGILEISAWNQANAVRQITVRRGRDVREFTLTTFGGSGSLLACRLIDVLDVPRVLVPPDPGTVSAFGLLTVDVRNDYVRTAVCRHDAIDPASTDAILDELRQEAAKTLVEQGFSEQQHRFLRSADLRYFGQAFEVQVSVPDGPVDHAAADLVASRFHDAHRDLYGYDFRGDVSQRVEWVNLRVTGVGPIRRPRPAHTEQWREEPATPAATGPVCFDPRSGFVETGSYPRDELVPGQRVDGPAIIEEYGSTVPIHPGFTAQVDRHRNLLITRGERDAAR